MDVHILSAVMTNNIQSSETEASVKRMPSEKKKYNAGLVRGKKPLGYKVAARGWRVNPNTLNK